MRPPQISPGRINVSLLSMPTAFSLTFSWSTFHIMLLHRSVTLVLIAPPIRLPTLSILEVLHMETRALELVRLRLESDQPLGDCSSLSFSRGSVVNHLITIVGAVARRVHVRFHLTDVNWMPA